MVWVMVGGSRRGGGEGGGEVVEVLANWLLVGCWLVGWLGGWLLVGCWLGVGWL